MLFLEVFIGLSIFTNVETYAFPLSDCRSRDMDIIFAIDCKYPIEGIEEKIKNILLDNFVNTTSKNSTRNLRVSVTDLRSSENLIFVDVEPLENYDSYFSNVCAASYRDGVNVDKIYIDKFEIVDNLPMPSFMIWIISCIEYEQFSSRIDLIIFIVNEACDYYWNLVNDNYVERVEDFKANHHLSLILCDDCSADIPALRSEVLKWRQNMSDSSANDSGVVVDIFIGISYFITGHNGPLLWINGRPVVVHLYDDLDALILKYVSSRACFSWRIYNVSYSSINIERCTNATRTYNLCETELSRYEIVYDSVVFDKDSEFYVYDQRTNSVVSVSDSRYLNNGIYSDKKNFPKFACSPNGPFISYRYVCDGYKDCNTGEDEAVCKFDSSKCKEVDSFMCLNRGLHEKQCVPMYARCNLIEDCLDGSDELDCDGCVGTRCVRDDSLNVQCHIAFLFIWPMSVIRNLCIVLSWLLGILLAAIHSFNPDLSLYSASGVCLGFPLRKSTGQAWIYSVVIFLILNSLIFVLSSCGQVATFYLIYTNNAQFKDSDQQFARRAEDIAVAKRLALVVVSNLICLLPVCILGLKTATSDFEVDRQTYAWIVALVLPANSAMNPFLYTIPGIYRKWEEYKNGPNQRRI
ncbi:hypothetical protein Btru_021478 [Bulinus truncatus]|nr:hypothetical protein Btru_021478 [Bulinus truncatus]